MSNALSTRVSQALRPIFGHDPFATLQHELDDVVSRFKTDWNGGWIVAGPSPSVDLSETADTLEIRMDVPGMKADEINIEVSGNTVRISGEHKEEKEEKGKTFHRVERRHGSFSRTVALPVAVKEDKVSADCTDGVLTITLPKTETARSHKIKVKSHAK